VTVQVAHTSVGSVIGQPCWPYTLPAYVPQKSTLKTIVWLYRKVSRSQLPSKFATGTPKVLISGFVESALRMDSGIAPLGKNLREVSQKSTCPVLDP